jgi:[acyl-carrier-protein] S-malonyltransferase
MGQIAFVFPGQGSQAAGMGKALHDSFEAARAVFAEADAVLGFPLSQLCCRGRGAVEADREHTTSHLGGFDSSLARSV